MDAEDEEESLYEDKSTLDVSGIKLDDTNTEDNKENLSTWWNTEDILSSIELDTNEELVFKPVNIHSDM